MSAGQSVGRRLLKCGELHTGTERMIPSMPNGACVRAAPPPPAAFLDGRGRGRPGRYLPSPSRNDKKARPLISSLARASYAPLSLPELRRGIFENAQNSEKPEDNCKTATDLMVHLPHSS